MLILFTPLPSANTGTAAYAAALLDDLVRNGGEEVRKHVVVAVDSFSSEEQGSAARSQGWTVLDFRSVAVARRDVCAYFLASNPYHYYCYEQLALQTRGRSVGIIHDLTAGFMIRELSQFLGSPYCGLLSDAFGHDLGRRSAAILRDYDKVDDVTKHFINAQGVTLEQCSELFVHSYYAKARLALETVAGEEIAERIKVCRHPAPSRGGALGIGTAGRRDRSPRLFTAGSLGYYSHIKRFASVVAGWSAFLERYPVCASCELLLGGSVPDKEKRRLLGLCDERFRSTIRFVGFLDEDDLHSTLERLDLLMALRFPSCGETSGMIAHALAYETPVAVSEFAAFREEPAAFRIPVEPEKEVEGLVTALKASFDAWSNGTALANEQPAWSSNKLSLARCLLRALEETN